MTNVQKDTGTEEKARSKWHRKQSMKLRRYFDVYGR